jgi:hypothetical protein
VQQRPPLPPMVGPSIRRTQARGSRRTSIEIDCDMEEDRNHADWPQHDAVSVKSQHHHADGHWAIDTVNPDGWTNILDYLKTTTADFVVGQEAKRAGKDDCQNAESAARTAGWKTSVTPCLTTKAMGKSAVVWSLPVPVSACRMLTRSRSPNICTTPAALA